MRKFISVILAILILTMSFSPAVFADEAVLSASEKSAAALQSLNLFKGTDLGFELEREPLRIECVVTIIRLLGQENAALSCTDENPFTDIPRWADRYAAYAYANGITKGVSETEFGYNVKADCQQFATLLLRALSYTEEAGDFSYNTALADGVTYKIIDNTVNSDKFLRGDMVIMSYLALSVTVKGSDKALSDTLLEKGIFTKEALENAKIVVGAPVVAKPEENPLSGSSSGGSSGGSSSGSSNKNDKDASEAKANLPQLTETVKDYYNELSKVIVLVDSEELHAQFDEITARVNEYTEKDLDSLSDTDAIELYDNLNTLFDDMEMLAITVAVER